MAVCSVWWQRVQNSRNFHFVGGKGRALVLNHPVCKGAVTAKLKRPGPYTPQRDGRAQTHWWHGNLFDGLQEEWAGKWETGVWGLLGTTQTI